MPFYFDAAADFATSLVVLTTLAWWYGAFRRWPFNGRAGALLMGAAFGLVAVLQMWAPIEPVDGMIVDLRVVPIALAGAYLGSTGLLACLMLAVAARFAIGGVGMEAGVASILVAGLCGLGWSALTARLARRDWRHFLALGALASLSLPTGLLLPGPLETWFFMSAAPVLALAYLTVIPLVAYLLERARTSLMADRDRGMNLEVDLPSGLATKNAFARHVAATNSSSPLPSVSSVLVLRIRHRGMLETYWGRKVVDQIFSALRVRLGPLVRFSTLLGRSCQGEVLVGLTEEEAADVSGLQKKMARAVSDTAVTLPGGKSLRVGVDVRIIPLSDPVSQDAILGDLAPAPIVPRPFRIDPARLARAAGGSHPWSAPDHDRLFSRLDRQMVSDD
jgi:hypothetical protein